MKQRFSTAFRTKSHPGGRIKSQSSSVMMTWKKALLMSMTMNKWGRNWPVFDIVPKFPRKAYTRGVISGSSSQRASKSTWEKKSRFAQCMTRLRDEREAPLQRDRALVTRRNQFESSNLSPPSKPIRKTKVQKKNQVKTPNNKKLQNKTHKKQTRNRS